MLGIPERNPHDLVVEVGDADFREPMPVVSQPERKRPLPSLLDTDYGQFPADSVPWFSRIVDEITCGERQQIEIFH